MYDASSTIEPQRSKFTWKFLVQWPEINAKKKIGEREPEIERDFLLLLLLADSNADNMATPFQGVFYVVWEY